MSYIAKSPWVIHYDGSSCNGCDIEVLACLTPMYDVERFGIINTGNPKHADVFLVTGSVNEQNKNVVKQIYEQMPEPKVVVAVGICACSGGVFKQCYNILGGVDSVIPVDVYVPGCAARPEAIIDGVVKGLAVLQQKRDKLKNAQDIEEAAEEEAEELEEIAEAGEKALEKEEAEKAEAEEKTEAAEPTEKKEEADTAENEKGGDN
jgi:ech hydrogenase subunit C